MHKLLLSTFAIAISSLIMLGAPSHAAFSPATQPAKKLKVQTEKLRAHAEAITESLKTHTKALAEAQQAGVEAPLLEKASQTNATAVSISKELKIKKAKLDAARTHADREAALDQLKKAKAKAADTLKLLVSQTEILDQVTTRVLKSYAE